MTAVYFRLPPVPNPWLRQAGGARAALLFVFVLQGAVLAVPVSSGAAQHEALAGAGLEDFPPLGSVTVDEVQALALAEQGGAIAAREAATAILKKSPRSFMAHLVLGKVLHEAEGSFPRALFHLEQAKARYIEMYGEGPPADMPWQFHALLLQQLADTHGDLEHHQERLSYIAKYNELYEPDMIAEQAWPLMKLGKYEEAKLAAQRGLEFEDRPLQRLIGLNALCAIQFEAGEDGESYDACKRAVLDAEAAGRQVTAVDLTNLAEAARSLFRLDEAEQLAVQATTAPVSYYGNPWADLADLYTRQGRFSEALAALKEIGPYRARRPPETRFADLNDTRRILASFLVALSRAEGALRITDRAMVRPDRKAYQSRGDVQDDLVLALLDRAGRRLAVELAMETAASQPWYARLWARGSSLAGRLSAWHSGRMASRALTDDQTLIGMFRLGTSEAAIMPPWLVGELVQVLGAGVVRSALVRARRVDKRGGARAYYDAIEAEAAAEQGDDPEALLLAERALLGLSKSEALLRARLHAIAAQITYANEGFAAARAHYEQAFQLDPGVFRRLSFALPVRPVLSGELAPDVASGLEASPRFSFEEQGFRLGIKASLVDAKVCLYGGGDAVIACGRSTRKAAWGAERLVQEVTLALHREAFAPRVTLTSADINSLDGSNLVGRDALEEALKDENL